MRKLCEIFKVFQMQKRNYSRKYGFQIIDDKIFCFVTVSWIYKTTSVPNYISRLLKYLVAQYKDKNYRWLAWIPKASSWEKFQSVAKFWEQFFGEVHFAQRPGPESSLQ